MSGRSRPGPGLALILVAILVSLAACSRQGPGPAKGQDERRKTIMVTYTILGSLVSDLAGDSFAVKTLVPNDIHEWEPSARDVEALMHADLIVANGIGLEGGMEKTLDRAREAGRPIFLASDQVRVRRVGQGEGIPSDDPDQAVGAEDPHLWTDPLAMKAVVDALALDLRDRFGVDLSARAAALDERLLALDAEIRDKVATLPQERRSIVTGHESMGWFAERYGFHLVGALVPSLSTQAGASASWLASLKGLIAKDGVKVIFTEIGTPRQVVDALSRETGARAIPLATHVLPADGSYFTFERELAATVVAGLE
jgi:zinc/manganese transport system substrate-binding protein